ncbi:MAG: tRNA 2-thiouridine(34) synthase MnmA [Chloroflexi bacterium]|nr:tRNA 2-thiouridine(34) synthase MnmA [Chloroflexota bacterium]
MGDSRILVAMSGGVDSAVAAAILHREGHAVVGVTLRLYTEEDPTALRSKRACCGVEDVADARAAAQRIGIPHYVLNMEREFERDVIEVFASAYRNGRTPNPCLECNDRVKFRTLLDRADALGFERLATGHYARIRERPVGAEGEGCGFSLHAAADEAKDQSYVLYTLGQEQLARVRFPLGDLPKAETRRIAAELDLGVADKPDSADICFVPGGDYRELLRARGDSSRPGVIVDADGSTLRRHEGVAAFTVGQRRGLGVATGERRYVTEIDAAAGAVRVGSAEDLLARGVEASAPRWVREPPLPGDRLLARIRAHGPLVAAQLAALDASGFHVAFEEPVRAAAPGQAIVLYRPDDKHGHEVAGGGTIERGLK